MRRRAYTPTTIDEIDRREPVTYDRAIRVLRQMDEFEVADWLQFIRNSSEPQRLRKRIGELEQSNRELVTRLQTYEPPTPEPVARSNRAGPMSDG